MSADPAVRQTLVDMLRERVKLVRWFRYNASVKHGVPFQLSSLESDQDGQIEQKPQEILVKQEPQEIKVVHEYPKTEQKEQDITILPSRPSIQPTEQLTAPIVQTTQPTKSKLRYLLPWILAGATTLGAGGAIVYNLWPEKKQDVQNQVYDPNLYPALQWLEDQGQNQP